MLQREGELDQAVMVVIIAEEEMSRRMPSGVG